MGDTRTHIFLINPQEQTFADMFTADGSQVILDSNGKAAVTLDFVCLRCHHGLGSAFKLDLHGVAMVAPAIHSGSP